jgi:hypothetical protein
MTSLGTRNNLVTRECVRLLALLPSSLICGSRSGDRYYTRAGDLPLISRQSWHVTHVVQLNYLHRMTSRVVFVLVWVHSAAWVGAPRHPTAAALHR